MVVRLKGFTVSWWIKLFEAPVYPKSGTEEKLGVEWSLWSCGAVIALKWLLTGPRPVLFSTRSSTEYVWSTKMCVI